MLQRAPRGPAMRSGRAFPAACPVATFRHASCSQHLERGQGCPSSSTRDLDENRELAIPAGAGPGAPRRAERQTGSQPFDLRAPRHSQLRETPGGSVSADDRNTRERPRALQFFSGPVMPFGLVLLELRDGGSAGELSS
jgi:hypothetical protein